jgi:hypothetical protein
VLLLLAAALVLALPAVIRWQVGARVTVLTGRPVTIRDVDLNLFTRRLVVSDLTVHDREGRPPLLEVARLQTRFRLWALLRGRVHLDDTAIVDPVARLVRLPSGRWSAADVQQRLRSRPAGKPVWLAVDRLSLRGGRVLVRDEHVEPATLWTADGFTLDVKDVGTERGHGSAFGTVTVAGARATLSAEDIRVTPVAMRSTISLTDLDLVQLGPYLSGTGVTLAGGTLGTRVTLAWDAGAGVLRAQAHGRVTAVTVARSGWSDPVVAVPELTFESRDIVWKDGTLGVARFEARAAPTVVDGSVEPAQRFEVTSLRALVEHANLPGGRRADVLVTARLADGARVTARGKARLVPLSADLIVALAAVDLGRTRPYVPPPARVAVANGRLDAQLTVGYDAPREVRASGDFTITDVEMLRQGQAAAFVRDQRLSGVLSNFRFGDAGVSAERVAIAGTPRIVDTTTSPPQHYQLASFSVAAEEVTWPARHPLRIAAGAALASGGSSTLSGTLHPATLEARARAIVTDLDVLRALPYLPPDPPVAPVRGRVSATVDLRHDRARGVVIDGEAVISDVALTRRGHAEPFVTDPRLTVRVSGLTVKDGQLALPKLVVSGAPSLVDVTPSPPFRLDLAALTLMAEHVTWPSRNAFRLTGTASILDGGGAMLDGSFDPGSLQTTARAIFTDLDVTRARGYLPPTAAVVPASGRVGATLDMTLDRHRGIVVDGTVRIANLALAHPGGQEPIARAPRVRLSIAGLAITDSTVSVGKAEMVASPSIADTSIAPPRQVQLSGLSASVSGDLWPGTAPARVAVSATLPERGAFSATGRVSLADRNAELTLDVRDAAVAPYRAFLPIRADVRGGLDAALQVTATWGDALAVGARGELGARDLAVGAPDRPVVSIPRATASGIELRWPDSVRADRVVIEQPSALIERDREGAFPLRAMLSPGPTGGGDRVTPAADGPPAGTDGHVPRPPRPVLTVGEVAIVDGDIRFLDRSTTPFYSEEATDLSVTIGGLTNAPDERATVRATGLVGATAGLDLTGEVAPFGRPFSLDVRGSLTDFALSRTNPYLRRLLDWIAVRGRLTTKVHYRIAGDELEASNEIVVERLDVEPAGPEPDKLVGLPLGLVVSLLKDTRGDIRIDVPISGSFRSPQFSFGDALATALRNVLTRLVAAPFRTIGSIFTRGETVAEVKVDPLVFDAGSASLPASGGVHLQRVADFLRAAPYVRLELVPVVTADDATALGAHEVAMRLQRIERERGATNFEDAVRRLYRQRFPDQAVPKDIQQALGDLRAAQAPAGQTMTALAARRLTTTRQALVDSAGIEPGRLVARDGSVTAGEDGQPRVEFRLLPED